MNTAVIIALTEKLQKTDGNMDPVNAILFVLRFKYKKELNKQTVPLFESITREMNLPVTKYRNWIHYDQLRESFYHYVRTHISPSKMNALLVILDPVEE